MGRAAQKLSMTQPPLSRRIQKLEREVGVPLFIRQPAGMTLTPAGKRFLTDAYRISSTVAMAVESARLDNAELGGTIRAGFTALSTFIVLPRLFKLANAYLPTVDLEVFERVSPLQIDLIQRGKIDVGFVRPQPIPADLAYYEIAQTPIVAVLPSAHPLTKAVGDLELADIARTPLIRYQHEGSPFLARLHDSAFSRFSTTTVVEVSQVLSGAGLVAEGFGAMLAPVSVAKLSIPGIVLKRVALPANLRTIPTWTVVSRAARGPLVERMLRYRDELSKGLAQETAAQMRSLSC